MRTLIVILLATAVVAEQKREAEPSYGHGYNHGYSGSVLSHRLGHALSYGQRPSYGHGYSGYSGYGHPARSYVHVSQPRLHKREADPEPKADPAPEPEAEASYVHQPHGYRHSGYSYGISHPTYAYPTYGRSHGYGHGNTAYPSHASAFNSGHSYVSVHHIHKREASPEPKADASPEPEASYVHNPHGYGHSGYSHGISHPSYAYPSYGRSLGYGRGYSAFPSHVSGFYPGSHSYVNVHRVHKREAAPEPAAEADPSYGYSYGHTIDYGHGHPSFGGSYGFPHSARVYGSHPSYGYHSARSYVGPRVHGASAGYTHAW